ncbi:hypothetical protein FACS1894133_6930 [Clostridia bacterium]|nr:hypothetical protein FACS1894133_6930 [Clostridia bacterium]
MGTSNLGTPNRIGRYAKRYVTLRRNGDFTRLYKKGKCYVRRDFVCYITPSKRRVSRLGITTTKKIGGAVVRSRARRVIREAFRHYEAELRERGVTGRYDFVFVARVCTAAAKSTALLRVMRGLSL